MAVQRLEAAGAVYEADPPERIDTQLLNQIENVLIDEPFSSIRYIAHITKSCPATVYRYVTIHLQRKYHHTRWVPHDLTPPQCKERAEKCMELAAILEMCKKRNWHGIITGDESMFTLSYGISGAWIEDGEKPPTMNGSKIQNEKIMITVMWSISGIIVLNMLPKGESFDSSYFIDNIIYEADQNPTIQKWRKTYGKIWVHLDNCRVHNSRVSMERMKQIKFERTPHPPYSPDIAPSDFFLFGYVKEKLKGQKFIARDELYEAVHSILSGISEDLILRVFESWITRCYAVSARNGSYSD